jgi:hypothetical protein
MLDARVRTGSSAHGREARGPSRRRLPAFQSALGTGAVLAQLLTALAADAPRIPEETIRQAEWISGVELTDDERNPKRPALTS